MHSFTRSTIKSLQDWLLAHSSGLPWTTRIGFRCLPPRCFFCGAPGDAHCLDLCMVCLAKLPWLDDLEMAPRFACGATAYSAFGYLPPIADSLKALKFAGDRRSARLFGALLAAAASAAAARCRGASGEVTIPDVILPVPLHHERYVARGFNQSLLIARQLGHWLERPVRCDGLLRIRATPPQARLTAAERRHNVAGAFFVAPQLRSDLRRRGLRRVVLVDDVLTTGATLEAAALALLESGVREVQCWSVARTMPTKTTSPT